MGVVACLQRDPSLKKVCEVLLDPLRIAAVMELIVATISASCIIKDEATGVTYMNTVTTSVGQVALSGPEQGAHHRGYHGPPVMN